MNLVGYNYKGIYSRISQFLYLAVTMLLGDTMLAQRYSCFKNAYFLISGHVLRTEIDRNEAIS